ncbi:OmpA family protein [Agarivorans sp. TSD2052]|uniref:flagellar motor protein MotB n=1 Tax=Agarivorans sp. TSD2052 TaxID=2937286 RepID=UPI00200FDBD9|nr:flagellar motor protein MotB [Agarivorans sp. TSD2052]UPW20030.1 OmpA family protein [Agarivorans sp. TSD2052]
MCNDVLKALSWISTEMRHRYAAPAKRNANTERWLVSYADYMTLMFALFVVLYSMAIANEQEYPELQQRLQQAIALLEISEPPAVEDSNHSILVGEGDTILENNNQAVIEDVIKNQPELEPLPMLAEQIALEFKDYLHTDDIIVSYDDQWLSIELDSRLFFASGSAYLIKPAEQIIIRLAGKLKTVDNYLRVRGYTDEDSIDSALYPSNWELSAARATRVLRELEANGVQPARMAIEAYAHYSPQTDQLSHSKSRRVVIALSNKRWQPPRAPIVEDGKSTMTTEKPKPKPDSDTMLAVPLEGGGVRFTTRQDDK